MKFMDIVKANGFNKVCIVGDYKWFPISHLTNALCESNDERLSKQLVDRYEERKDRIVGVLWSTRIYHLVNPRELHSFCSDGEAIEITL